MVRKMLEKMNVPKNAQMEACKPICSSNHGTDIVGTVAYLSAQVTEIFPMDQLESKKSYKRRISEIRSGRGGGRGRGRGKFQQGGGQGGRDGRGGSGGHNDPAVLYNTFNGVDIRDHTRDFSTEDWDNLGYDGRAYVTRFCSGRSGGQDDNHGGRNTGDN